MYGCSLEVTDTGTYIDTMECTGLHTHNHILVLYSIIPNVLQHGRSMVAAYTQSASMSS